MRINSTRLFSLPASLMSAFRIAGASNRALLFGAIIVFLTACTDLTAPLASEGKPTALEFSIGGFGAASRQLELRGDTVVARRRPFNWVPNGPNDSVRVVPSADAWRTFWAAAGAAGVQTWHADYRNDLIADGQSWSIRLGSSTREINSWGNNGYPDRRGGEHEGEETVEFKAFKSALNTLVAAPNWF